MRRSAAPKRCCTRPPRTCPAWRTSDTGRSGCLTPSWPGGCSAIPRVGLGPLVENVLGLALEKGYAAADWSTRPLPEDWLRYAALDVEVLVDLRDALAAELVAQGKDEWARQEFTAVLNAGPPPPRTDPWRRTSGIHRVRTRRGLAIVRELWLERDRIAQRRDLSPGRVLPDSAIVEAARAAPTTAAALAGVSGFKGRGAKRHAQEWFAAIRRAHTEADQALPRPSAQVAEGPPPAHRWHERDPEAARRLAAVRTVIAALSDEHSLPAENMLQPDSVRRLAWQPPDPVTGEAVAADWPATGPGPGRSSSPRCPSLAHYSAWPKRATTNTPARRVTPPASRATRGRSVPELPGRAERGLQAADWWGAAGRQAPAEDPHLAPGAALAQGAAGRRGGVPAGRRSRDHRDVRRLGHPEPPDAAGRAAVARLRGAAHQASRSCSRRSPGPHPAPPGSASSLPPGRARVTCRGARARWPAGHGTGPGRPAGPGLHVAAARVLASRGGPAAIRPARHGSYLAIVEPIRYRAHHIPYAYSAEDFALDVTSPAGTGSPGTLVVGVSLARIGQATDHLLVILLAASGLVLLATGWLAAWVIRAALRPDRVAPELSALMTRLEDAPSPGRRARAGGPGPPGHRAETPGHRRHRP